MITAEKILIKPDSFDEISKNEMTIGFRGEINLTIDPFEIVDNSVEEDLCIFDSEEASKIQEYIESNEFYENIKELINNHFDKKI